MSLMTSFHHSPSSPMKSLKLRELPWLPPPNPTRNPIAIPTSIAGVFRMVRDPTSTPQQIITAFSVAAHRPNLSLNHDIYHKVISLFARHRRFRLADVVLTLMRRRDGLDPGSTVLIRLAEAYRADGRHSDAAGLFLKFPGSNRFFSFLVETLLTDAQLDVAESLFTKAADLGFQIQVRHYNALIKGFCDHLRVDDGIRVFGGMVHSGVLPDVVTFSTLMDHLWKEGRILGVNVMFGKMVMMGIMPDDACFKILFRMYWRNHMVSKAVGVLKEMGILVEGDVVGLDDEVGDWIFGAVLKRGFFLGDKSQLNQMD